MDNLKDSSDTFRYRFDKFLIACDSLENGEEWNVEANGEMDVFYTGDLISVIIRLIAADGVFTRKEVDYLNEIFGFKYTVDELEDLYYNLDDELEDHFRDNAANGITMMRELNPKLAEEYKDLLCLACDIVSRSDGVIDHAEAETAQYLMSI